MKVRELIELLQEQDPEREVLTEGCDCNGRASGVILVNEEWAPPFAPFVYITRCDV